MRREQLACIVLAAGESKRMRSARSKALHPLCGVPLVTRVLKTLRELKPSRLVVVISAQAEEVEALARAQGAMACVQQEQRGTGHAVLQAAGLFADFEGTVLVTCVDIPLLSVETLRALHESHRRWGAAATLLTAEYRDPTGYGRVVRGRDGTVRQIIEHRDADAETRRIKEINSSVYCFRSRLLFELVGTLSAENAAGEQYLTDVIGMLAARGERVEGMIVEDPQEIAGINTRVQLAEAERILRDRIRERVMLTGATLIDPATIYLDEEVEVGRDTTIWPGSFLLGRCATGQGCTIGPHAVLEDCELGDRVRIRHGSLLQGSRVGDDASVGPFAHVRADCAIGARARIGSYIELKAAEIGAGSKASHFSYLGDTRIGPNANLGAGTVTCNYDGVRKHPTIIEERAFIGSNVSLVAPVTIGSGAYVAAGSTITEDVPPKALAVGRSRQRNIEGWAAKRDRT